MPRLLLVTSSMHMPRASAVFRAQGIDVIPAPVDVQVTESDTPRVFYWIPSAHALSATTSALKEYMGFLYYRLRGYI